MQKDENRIARLKWGGLALTILTLAFFMQRWGWFGADRAELNWIQSLGEWRVPVFIGFSILATVGMVPGSLICASGGILFGFWEGMFWSWMGINLGAVAAFLTGRFWVHDWVEQKMKQSKWYQSLSSVLTDGGWKTLLLIRLLPIVPFNGLNYALSLTKVSLRNYTLAAMLGLIPGAVMYSYLGCLMGDLAQLRTPRPKEPWEWGIEGIGFLILVIVSLVIGRKVMNIFRKLSKDHSLSSA
jgi:uncharacterized membrane protein YdjX (TVP38/TMEM64 family)